LLPANSNRENIFDFSNSLIEYAFYFVSFFYVAKPAFVHVFLVFTNFWFGLISFKKEIFKEEKTGSL
jgi:hypothetical protein